MVRSPRLHIRLDVAITVDPEAWDLDFGTGTQARAVSDDVAAWLKSMIDTSTNTLDSTVKVTVAGSNRPKAAERPQVA